ncbi:Translocon-associated protein subunit beta isoform 3 [Schistosoma japonicum]|uniref:Translocon-associated protein subunit beta isoform 3 n=1 Tax=Schistosoma japonicum TaxID=6182 RepID=A0A4Z2D5U2_SCHJA|nr:Translocon-associated protein subunit beta isoform 3 [Schistosoma japonicum]
MLTLYLSALMAVFLVVSVSSDSGDNVRLVVSKEILNEFIFEEKEMTVLYTIYNFHESRAARDVELLDTFAETEFTLIHGSPSARWSVIPASSNVTHVLILKPQINGFHNFSSATITYKSNDLLDSAVSYNFCGMYIIFPILYDCFIIIHYSSYIVHFSMSIISAISV